MALWDFYNERWKEVVDGGVGFEDSQDPNSRVKYVILQFSLEMKRRAYYTNSEAMAIYTQVDDFVNDLALVPSAGTKTPVHTTTVGKWKFMHTQKIYVQYALGGIACAIALAYVVLMIATNNIITSSLAIATICSVCICVLGSMVFAGWELGNIESICLTILAGFCVDYIVHLAHSYMESPDKAREMRVRYSVGHMGISVLSGALTSLGAALLLFFCTLQFFSSFGTFFFGTIFLAWLWANFFFIPALGTVGPAGTTGDLIGGICGGASKTPTDSDKANDSVANPVAAED